LIAILWQIGQGFLSSLREDAKVSQMEWNSCAQFRVESQWGSRWIS
jgi:hypothetical protein